MTVYLPRETVLTLREKAASAGVTLEVYLQNLAQQDADDGPPRSATLDDILAPIREGFAESGLSEDELTNLFEEAREEVWQEQQKQKGSSE
ncbi:hypothetical protein FRUB_03962 [Fimbriiglobus ruber]|uniref:Uncharacterized protein n=1 Tax=Fimbriiglobus ruber TaxID=1908690 RepID=A0A225DQJ1_9BACT|nr:hypothetical protein FRUB_03962 [Fimbriiglobus ruber]